MAEEKDKQSWLGGVVLSLVTLLLCFGIIEAFLAFDYSGKQKALRERAAERQLCLQHSPHPELIYSMRPNLPGCQSNSRGFRDREHELAKPDSVQRVVLIGDSVAMGQGVALRKTFTRVLEDRLNARQDDDRYEVIALAQSGYSTVQQLFLLEHEASLYDPDLIVWLYVLNDPADPVLHNANGEIGRYFYTPRSHTVHFVRKKWLEIRERLLSEKCSIEYHAFLHCVYRKQVAGMIGQIGEWSTQQGVPVLFAVHPVFKKDRSGAYPLTDLHTQLRANAEDAGLLVLDLYDAYAPHPLQAVAQVGGNGQVDRWHPNEAGTALAADAIYSRVIEGDVLRIVPER